MNMDMKLKLICLSLVVIVALPTLSVATTSAGTTDRGVGHATTTIKGNAPPVYPMSWSCGMAGYSGFRLDIPNYNGEKSFLACPVFRFKDADGNVLGVSGIDYAQIITANGSVTTYGPFNSDTNCPFCKWINIPSPSAVSIYSRLIPSGTRTVEWDIKWNDGTNSWWEYPSYQPVKC